MKHPATDEWARRLAEIRHLMAEQAASLDASGDFPRDNIDRLRQRGFLSLAVPLQYGGAGADLPRLQQAIAAIAWGEPATALIVCMQYLHHLRLAENENWSEPLRQRVFHDAVERGGLINSLRRNWAPRRAAACRKPWRPAARKGGRLMAIKVIPPVLRG